MDKTIISSEQLAIMSSRIAGIAKHMTYVLQSSARSSIMSGSRDFSTAVCDGIGDVISLPDGLPVHVTNMSVTTKSFIQYHGENFKEGDAYLNNSPYHGNTHTADYTICIPVFYEEELMFYCTIRGHQADVGNSIPTTYNYKARDIYEEGAPVFPCVKIQEDYKDIEDIIRMAKTRIRVSDVWYGDYLAMIGAARIGERELKKVIEKYGKETVKEFCGQWQEYGKKRMIEEIRKLPSGTWSNESVHDPIPDMVPEGIPVKVKVTIDSEEGQVIVDYTESGDPVPCGLNLCEATVIASGRSGFLNFLGMDLPLCEGALSQIKVKMREKGVVGKATLPYSSSVATTNVADRAVLAVQSALNGITEDKGMAEGALSHPAHTAVISGHDARYGRDFVTQLTNGHTGGMGVKGHDGYVKYHCSSGGMSGWSSIEQLEQKYPILYLEQELISDTGGAGEWDGAPATKAVITPTEDEITFIYLSDGKFNPPKGAEGGYNGTPSYAAIYNLDEGESSLQELPMFHQLKLKPKEALVSKISSGGGYGDPLKRDPEKVKEKVIEKWISNKKARDIYGVVLETDPIEKQIYVNYDKTKELRKI